MTKLQKDYQDAVNNYIGAFKRKHKFTIEVDELGHIYIYECLVNFDDIKFDIDTKQQKHMFYEWFMLDDFKGNYQSYCMGLRPEYIKESEKQLDEEVEKYVREKHIEETTFQDLLNRHQAEAIIQQPFHSLVKVAK